MNLCLVGGGRIGTIHLNHIVSFDNVNLVAVVESFEKRRNEMAAQARTKGFASLEEALNDASLDIHGVMICTPTHTHTELIKLALNGGKHVFCEKPIAESTQEVDELYALAKEKNLTLLCAFQRRFDPSFMKLKKAITEGQIGKVQVIKTTSRDHPLPSFEFLKTSGGIFHDCAIHDIDVHRWLSGEDPVEVFATGYAHYPEIASFGDYDAVVIVFKFPSGLISTVDLHRNALYGYDQRIEVMGSEGMVQADNTPRTSLVISNGKGLLRDQINHSFNDRYVDAYKNEVLHFVSILKGEDEVKVLHMDVRNGGIIANAAQESAKTGKPVVIDYS